MDYDFVEDLSEEFTCQVCMKLLNEPQLTDCCGQHFCRACLDRWFQQKGKKRCPHCRSEDLAHIVDKKLQRKIKEVKVYCPKRKEGCKETMKIEELERHLFKENTNGCGYITVECTNRACFETCLRKDLDNHTKNTCKHREVKCQYCGKVGQYWDITSSFLLGHIPKCQDYPVGCPNKCATVRDLRRKDLEAHRKVCSCEPVECPFSEAGCKKQLVRKDLDRHIQTNTQQHLLVLMNSHKAILRENKKFKLLHSTLVGELEALKPRVMDRASVAKSLERITETLSQVCMRLVKAGDELIFSFNWSLPTWKSPMFQVNEIKMILEYSEMGLELVSMDGELDGKYEVRVGFSHVNDNTGEQIIDNNRIGCLCSKCTKLSKKCESGWKINMKFSDLPRLPPLPRTYSTSIITATLIEHNCQAERK